MNDFQEYGVKYPDLVVQILEFFALRNDDAPDRTVGDFCGQFKVMAGEQALQPVVVSRICDRLCEMRKMVCTSKKGYMGLWDTYYAKPLDQAVVEKYRIAMADQLNCRVFGFEYICRHYKERTLPIVVEKEKGPSMGTCFKIYDGLATARHCLMGRGPVSIRGYKTKQLEKCQVFVSHNPDIDVAFIKTGDPWIYNKAEPQVLDNVLVMGYPRVPMFFDFCAGEKANVSAMADLRLTPTRGAVAAEGEVYFSRNHPKVMLITARIRGGNSGGPVINEDGYVVGIATGMPEGEGLSNDDVGYGMAYPIQVLDAVIKENNTIQVDFMDFPD